MALDADAIIVGGGLAGPALALALAGAGLRVTLIDAQPARARTAADFDGRAYALALASQRLLAAVGVWPLVAAEAQPITQVRASDGRPGEGASALHLNLDAAEIEDGAIGFMLEDRFLAAGLQDAMAAQPLVTQIAGVSVVAQEIGGLSATVTLDDGRRPAACVIIGCDGRQSGTASRAGIERDGWGYGQTAVVCALDHERPHGGVAQQFFMATGPLAILPLPGRRSSIVWSETEANARTILALDGADFLAVLRPRFGDHLGAISLAGPRFGYPLGLTLARSYVAPRLALAGDAAHGVHPLAGQGLNLGLRDVAALAQVLVEARRRGEDIGAAEVLARYQSWRRFDATAMALGMDRINRLFSNDNPILRLGRDLGLGLVNAVPGLRRGLMRQAAGIAGDPPQLLTGRPL